jgi:hypothetical protein
MEVIVKQAVLKKMLAGGAAAIGIIAISTPAAFAMGNNYGNYNSYSNYNNPNCYMMRGNYGNDWNNNGSYWSNMYGRDCPGYQLSSYNNNYGNNNRRPCYFNENGYNY